MNFFCTRLQMCCKTVHSNIGLYGDWLRFGAGGPDLFCLMVLVVQLCCKQILLQLDTSCRAACLLITYIFRPPFQMCLATFTLHLHSLLFLICSEKNWKHLALDCCFPQHSNCMKIVVIALKCEKGPEIPGYCFIILNRLKKGYMKIGLPRLVD